ncbi:MAG: carboxypeptidase regulatory-like domain-containing protein [Acidobacteriaceae bacterium]|nr:carboxypeptidase regulatory-like domain-containing protein [Acidobacteriaceae bacterium]
MNVSWVVLVPFVICISARGVAQNQPPQPDIIQGIVLDSETGKPLAAAAVDLKIPYSFRRRVRVASIATNNAGAFTFRPAKKDVYVLTASKVGYLSDDATPEKDASLSAGQQRRGLVFRLLREGVLRGRLTDADGDLVAQAEVTAWQWHFAGGQRYLVKSRVVTPAPDGTFRIGRLRPGLVYLSAARSWPQAEYGNRARADASAPTFYPDASDSTSAKPFRIVPGTNIDGIEFRMRRTTLFRLNGTVAGPPGMKIVEVSLCAEWLKRNCRTLSVTTSGRFARQFVFENVPAGQYEIRGYALQPSPTASHLGLAASQLVTVDDRSVDLLVPYSPDPEVRTTIQGGAGLFRLYNLPDDPTPAILRYASDGQVPGAIHVRPGRYLPVASELPEGMHLKSIRSQGTDVTGGFQVTTASVTVDIILAPGAATVSGIVRDGRGTPLPEVPVTVWSEADGPPAFTRTAMTDGDARYRFANLAPGVYRIAAWQGISEGMAQYRQFLSAFGRSAKAIQLVDGAREQIDLSAIDRKAAILEADKLR